MREHILRYHRKKRLSDKNLSVSKTMNELFVYAIVFVLIAMLNITGVSSCISSTISQTNTSVLLVYAPIIALKWSTINWSNHFVKTKLSDLVWSNFKGQLKAFFKLEL